MFQRPFFTTYLALTLALTTLTCQAVVGGAGVDPNIADSPWAGVGAVETGNGHFSGALIGPRHVLTAAHVVSGRPVEQVTFRLNRGDSAPPIPARAIHLHPAYQGTAQATVQGKVHGGIWHDDLAIIELERPAPVGTPVYPLHTEFSLQNAQILFVGYGLGGDGVAGPVIPSSRSTKRVGYNRVKVLSGKPTAKGRLDVFLFDFDAPRSEALGTPSAKGDGIEATFAGGDSGAPVFVFDGGTWQIMGVAAFVMAQPGRSGLYGSMAGSTLVPSYLGWIRQAVAGNTTGLAGAP